MKPSEAIANIEYARRQIGCESDFSEEALDMAISALEKQEVDKCCETCKYKNLPANEFPCDECYFVSDFEDYYEPYTEEES